MRSLLIIVLTAICFASCNKTTNQTEVTKGKQTKKIWVNAVPRDYILYIPETYNASKSYPLLFAFHGLGGNMESSYSSSKFYELAESENFIVVHPNGLLSKWDALTANNNADVVFTKELITELEKNYAIDSKRIYSTGMSNGGYFSYLLACEMSDKIAGIASVTGLMFPDVFSNCSPNRAIPILQIHGTDDSVVSYANVDTVLNYWRNNNHTDLTPIQESIPNINQTDGSTAERYSWNNGDNKTSVQHIKIIGGGHDWPGHKGNMDINASEEVWNFLKQYDINGKIE